MELDLFEETATFPSDGLVEITGEDAPTQTRPRILLPPPKKRDVEPWVARAESLLDAIEHMRDRRRRMALHRELAALLLANGDANQAFEVLVAALAEDIDDDEVEAALDKVARANDRLGDLLRTALAWAEDIEWMREPARLGSLLMRIAKWYAEDVGKTEWGMPFAVRARRLLPDRDPRPHRLLARLHRRERDFDRADQALDDALARAPSAELRAELLVERGRILEDRGLDPSATFAAAFDADPGSPAAWSALDAVASDRVAILTRHVAALRAPVALEAARLRLVELLAAAGDHPRAAAVLEDVILADPSHQRALDTLIEVRRRMGDFPGLRAALEHAIDSKPTARERVDNLLDLASLLVESFGDYDGAVARLEQVLEFDPSHDVAFKALAQLHRSRFHAPALAEVLERHARTVPERAKRAALLVEAAKVVADMVGDRPRALALAEQAVELAPDDVNALDVVGRLHAALGRTGVADELFGRAAMHARDPERRAELLFRRAQIRRAQGDLEGARELLRETLDAAPEHLGALAERRALATADGDPAAAARDCVRELDLTDRPQRRIALLLELARLRTELDDRAGAIACWEDVLEIQPANIEAAAQLIEPYVERGRFEDVHRLATTLLSSGTGDQTQRARWHALHGRALKSLGHAAEASRALAEAVRLRDDDAEALEALAETRFAEGDFVGAFAADTRLLGMLDSSEHDRLLTVHHRMGRVHHRLGRSRGALASFEQALALDPEHLSTLECLVEVHLERDAWGEAAAAQRRLVEATVDVDARVKLLAGIADIWSQRANNPVAAIEALEEACDERPRDLALLHRLLELYPRVGGWAKMADVLARIAEIDRAPERRAKYLYTLGQVHREETLDLPRALDAFEKALDEDPTQLRSFEAVCRIHTAKKDWKALERAYRRMLHRVAGKATSELELELWSGLGLVYRDRLADPTSAIEAFKMASRARPTDARLRRIIADLHASAGRVDDAARELHTAVAQHPLHAEPYRALFRLYRDAQRIDRAWCLASALVLLDKADEEIRGFHARWQRRSAPAYRGRLDPPTFTRAIRHPEEDLLVSKIFEMILPAVRTSRARRMGGSIAPPANVHWEDPSNARTPVSRAFFGVADVLSIPAPRLALRPDREGGFVAVGTEPPATAVGRTVLSLQRNEDVLFAVGQHLSTWRGDAHLRVLFPDTRALEQLFVAALRLVKSDLAVSPEAEQTGRTLAPYLEPVQFESLRVVVKRFLAERTTADIKAWSRGLERTAARTGLLMCGDLATAVQSFDDGRLAALGVPASDVVGDLVAWFVSPEHLELRERLGITLGPR